MTTDTLPASAPIEGALAALDTVRLANAYKSEEAMKALLADVDAEIEKFPEPDLTTAKGRDEIKANAYKVTRSKTALDDTRKTITEDARKFINEVNARGKLAVEHLADRAAKVRKPLTEWEEAEKARKDALAEALMALRVKAEIGASEDLIASEHSRIADLYHDTDWQEMMDEAASRYDTAINRIGDLREFREEQDRKEREAQEARAAAAAAEKARQEAEAKAEAERAAAEAERQKEREAAQEAQRKADEAIAAAQAEAAKLKAELDAARQGAFAKAEEEARRADAETAEREAAPVGADPEKEAAPVAASEKVSRETPPPSMTAEEIITALEIMHDQLDMSRAQKVVIMAAIAYIRWNEND